MNIQKFSHLKQYMWASLLKHHIRSWSRSWRRFDSMNFSILLLLCTFLSQIVTHDCTGEAAHCDGLNFHKITFAEFNESWQRPKMVWLPMSSISYILKGTSKKILRLRLDMYLFKVIDTYPGKMYFWVTITGNVTITGWVVPVVTILLLHFVIQKFQWNSFRKNITSV